MLSNTLNSNLKYIFISVFIVFSCSSSDKRKEKMITEGNQVIKKIDLFKNRNNKLPKSLTEIGLEEKEGFDVLYYTKRDSLNYTLSFPISAETHVFYYSDSRKWEKGYRKM